MDREKGLSLMGAISDYTVIDVETTGYDLKRDEIIEIGALKVRGNETVARFQKLIRGIEVDEFIAELTGITTELLSAEGAELSEAMQEFLDFVGDDILLGYNVRFDVNFLYDSALRVLGQKLKNDSFDVLRISRRKLADLPSRSLSEVAKHYKIKRSGEHRSMLDCETTHQVYQHMKQLYDLDELAEELKKKKSKKNGTYHQIKAGDIIAENTEFDEDHPLFGQLCVFTGTLEKLTRAEAMQVVVNCGGLVGDGVTAKTNYLILGNSNYYSERHGGVKSSKLKKAESLQLKGKDITILPESAFYDMLEAE